MQEVVISDASCLILLDKINELDLLRLVFQKVIIPHEVFDEVGIKLPNWIVVENAIANEVDETIKLSGLDRGEAAAIVLAQQHKNALLIIDEFQGRRYAKSLGLRITGTLGVIVNAKKQGIIPSVKPIVEKMLKTNFRISTVLLKSILKED